MYSTKPRNIPTDENDIARRQPPQRVFHTLCQIPSCLAEHPGALVAEATLRPGLRNPNLRAGAFAGFTQGPPKVFR